MHGKTGTGYQLNGAGSGPDLRRQIGWSSGGARTLVFACVIRDEHPESTRAGPRARAQFLTQLPRWLATLPGAAH